MKKKQYKNIEVLLPQGYDFEEIYDTDDGGYDFEEPIVSEEVKLRIE
jgi:hypothetical protein